MMKPQPVNSRQWTLLASLIFAFAIFPPIGVWLWTLAPDGVFRFVALPMALQLDLSELLFGPALFVHTEEVGSLPTPAGWLVTITIWLVIAVVLWTLIRAFIARRRRDI